MNHPIQKSEQQLIQFVYTNLIETSGESIVEFINCNEDEIKILILGVTMEESAEDPDAWAQIKQNNDNNFRKLAEKFLDCFVNNPKPGSLCLKQIDAIMQFAYIVSNLKLLTVEHLFDFDR